MSAGRAKHTSYRYAFARMRRMHDLGATIESSALAESIIADRLFSYLVAEGETLKSVESTPLSALLRKLEPRLTADATFTLAELVAFKGDRNVAMHAAVKSLPGTAPMTIEEYEATTQRASTSGMRLARLVSNWAGAAKRRRFIPEG